MVDEFPILLLMSFRMWIVDESSNDGVDGDGEKEDIATTASARIA